MSKKPWTFWAMMIYCGAVSTIALLLRLFNRPITSLGLLAVIYGVGATLWWLDSHTQASRAAERQEHKIQAEVESAVRRALAGKKPLAKVVDVEDGANQAPIKRKPNDLRKRDV